MPQCIDLSWLDAAIRVDLKLGQIILDLTKDPQSHPHYSFIQQWLFYKGKLVIPSTYPDISNYFQNSILLQWAAILVPTKRISI